MAARTGNIHDGVIAHSDSAFNAVFIGQGGYLADEFMANGGRHGHRDFSPVDMYIRAADAAGDKLKPVSYTHLETGMQTKVRAISMATTPM